TATATATGVKAVVQVANAISVTGVNAGNLSVSATATGSGGANAHANGVLVEGVGAGGIAARGFNNGHLSVHAQAIGSGTGKSDVAAIAQGVFVEAANATTGEAFARASNYTGDLIVTALATATNGKSAVAVASAAGLFAIAEVAKKTVVADV